MGQYLFQLLVSEISVSGKLVPLLSPCNETGIQGAGCGRAKLPPLQQPGNRKGSSKQPGTGNIMQRLPTFCFYLPAIEPSPGASFLDRSHSNGNSFLLWPEPSWAGSPLILLPPSGDDHVVLLCLGWLAEGRTSFPLDGAHVFFRTVIWENGGLGKWAGSEERLLLSGELLASFTKVRGVTQPPPLCSLPGP